MYGQWMDEIPLDVESKKEEFKLEEKIDRIAHPLKHKIIDAKDNFAIWLLRL